MLKRLRKARGWTQEQLAEAVGLAHSTIGHAERGRPASIGEEDIRKLAKVLGAEPDPLIAAAALEKQKPSVRKALDTTRSTPPGIEDVSFAYLPPKGVHGTIAALDTGGLDIRTDEGQGVLLSEQAHTFRVLDGALYPRAHAGDWVYCDTGTPDIGEFVILRLRDGTQLFREFRGEHRGKVTLLGHADDGADKILDVSKRDIRAMLVIVGIYPRDPEKKDS